MLSTEQRNPASMGIDTMSTADMLAVMQQANIEAAQSVESQLPTIGKAVDAISQRMAKGGRLFYIGCGTSGRLGVLDASECPPTFGVSPELVVGIIAGGDKALRRSSEGAEDNHDQGAADLLAHNPTALDSLVGISVAGGAAYVVGALEKATELGLLTIGLTCNEGSKVDSLSTIAIHPATGPEVVTGSTRLKAGTAHKMILNMISTSVMIRLGHVYSNLMISVSASNIKLRARAVSILRELTALSEIEANQLLEANNWSIRQALAQTLQ